MYDTVTSDGTLFYQADAASSITGGRMEVSSNQTGKTFLYFDPSRVVPTGPDNAPVNIAVRYWRRIY
jgi:hypothetical protein